MFMNYFHSHQLFSLSLKDKTLVHIKWETHSVVKDLVSTDVRDQNSDIDRACCSPNLALYVDINNIQLDVIFQI